MWDGPQAETFVWRGTMEMHTLREFLTDVHWGELDILLLDLPPGTDRLATLNDLLPDLHGSVVVTIPSARFPVDRLEVDHHGARPSAHARHRLGGEHDGLRLPHLRHHAPAFSPRRRRPKTLAGVPLLGRVPFDPRMALAGDKGVPFILEDPTSPAAQALAQVGEGVLNFVNSGSPVS